MQRPSRIIARDRIRQVVVRPHQTGPRRTVDDSAHRAAPSARAATTRRSALRRAAARRQGAVRSGARQQQESWEAGMSKRVKGLTRRQFAKAAGATAALAAVPMTHIRKIYAANPIELTHWSWLAASDGEVWAQMIQNFNDAHKDKGVQIKMEVIAEEQYTTKVLAAAATGNAPDFGWGTAGQHAQWAQDGVTVPLDDLAKSGGLDLSDFSDFSLKMARFPKYDNKLFMIPMDLMSLQPEVNLDHVKEAGLDPEKFPQDGDSLIEWAKAMTKRDGDKVTRSGIMMTGSGVQPTVTWGIVAEQMGFQRASADLKTAAG